uniref:Major capsid protein n=1 Tax=Cressdnaviricota sp. TaxID=2748378 RepID=A0A6M3YQ08_9VIRU|nr:MAG: major capsid protein [Cressdnaviricota sp.]
MKPKGVRKITNRGISSVHDELGNLSVNMFPFLMYYLIWNEYYRDQDLQTEVSFEDWISGYTPTSLSLLAPCWSKDYFTTARPWPQKGPEVTIPVNLTSGGSPLISATTTLSGGSISGNGAPSFNVPGNTSPDFNNSGQFTYTPGGSLANWSNPALKLNNPTATTDITWNGGPDTTGSISINDFREGLALQRFEEHRALWGSRYEDLLRYLGVRPQDARLQLPEYLGGFSSPIQFSEVLQTSAGEAGGVGDLYGHGISAARSRRIRRFIPEHGYIMTLLCVRPISVYAQGIERLWSKSTKYDFWTKELEHIGQQEVFNSEVYADGSSDDGNTFGFQNRYDEYRRGVSVVTGEFRTNQDFWTLARIFANRPALNSDFVECNPSDRIFQVGQQNSDQLYAMVKNNVIAKRLVSKNGNPI